MQLTDTTVALDSCPDYEPSSLAAILDRVHRAVDPPVPLADARVVLKPNLIGARRGPLACTGTGFILAVARWYLDQGARVVVGDSPAFGSATSVLSQLGALDPLTRLGVGVSDFSHTRTLILPSGRQARFAAEALECDLLVNLPRVKAHAQMRLTLAVKNCFGCLTGMQKPWWHMIHGGRDGGFASLLLEILEILPQSLTLVDGITAMHRTGPLGGDPFELGIVAAGRNPVAVDTALVTILGVEPASVPLQQAALAMDFPGSRPEQLCCPLACPDDLRVTGFQVPATLNPVRFSLLSFLRSSLRRLLKLDSR